MEADECNTEHKAPSPCEERRLSKEEDGTVVTANEKAAESTFAISQTQAVSLNEEEASDCVIT